MSKSHNKKRNVGLVYEFLVRYISRALVEDRQQSAASAVNILNRRFKAGTELYKEFRLFNSLLTTTVTSSNVVGSIISEARNASRQTDHKELDIEKSKLIREINHSLQDPSFFNQQVENYKIYATIQTLLNDWKSGGDINIAKMATYEDNLSQWLLSEKKQPIDLENYRDGNVNDIVMNIMIEKLEQKYCGVLTEKQQELIKVYATASHINNNDEIGMMMTEIRAVTTGTINNFMARDETDDYLNEKLLKMQALLKDPEITVISDANIENHLKFIKLTEELQV